MFLRTMLLLVVCSLLGCASTTQASLREVRAFADASASLGGYAELSRRYRDTYAREQPYLAPAADQQARLEDARRQAAYTDFVAIQQAVVRYMQILSVLAGDARYDLGPRLDEMGAGLKAGAGSALTERQITAYTGIARLLAGVVASGYQQRNVASMVRDGDADLQALLDAMIALTRLYAKTNDNEKKTVLGTLSLELVSAPRGTDRLLLVLARVHLADKTAEYSLLERRYDLAMQGLTRVAQGHQRLRENLERLTGEETRRMVAGYAGDLNAIRDGLRE